MKQVVLRILCVILCCVVLIGILSGCEKNVTEDVEEEIAHIPGETSLFRGLEPDEMFIGGFIGPRASYYRNGKLIFEGLKDDAVFKLIKEAGINYISDNDFSYSEDMLPDAQKALQYAQDNDLMYFMPAYDIMQIDGEIMASDEAISTKLQEMYQYDSFGGLYLRDEPTSDMFPFIGDCIDKLNDIQGELGYTDLNVYLNLLLYLSPEWLSNGTDPTMTWQKYIRYLSEVGAEYLSFDMYPISGEGTAVARTWFNYLGMMNEAALEVGKPWMGYAQVGGGLPSYPGGARVTTEGEMKWDVNTMLAFGAKGISYYILVSPPYFADTEASQMDNHSLINAFGYKTEFWYYAKDINIQIAAMDHILMNSRHEGVILAGNSPCPYEGNGLVESYRGLKKVTGNALVGCFDYQGQTALLVVNNDFTKAGEITLSLDKKYTCKVIQSGSESKEKTDQLTVQLAAGDCALVVLNGYHVSYDLNYGTPKPDPVSDKVVLGEAYGALPVPEPRSGYAFGGWYLNSDLGGEPVENTQSVSGSHTLYAKWIYLTDPVILRSRADEIKINKFIKYDVPVWEYTLTSELAQMDTKDRRIELYWDEEKGDSISFRIQLLDWDSSVEACVENVLCVKAITYDGALNDISFRIADVYGESATHLEIGQWYSVDIFAKDMQSLHLYLLPQSQGINMTLYFDGVSVGK